MIHTIFNEKDMTVKGVLFLQGGKIQMHELVTIFLGNIRANIKYCMAIIIIFIVFSGFKNVSKYERAPIILSMSVYPSIRQKKTIPLCINFLL
jgi:hypothetical protein